MLYTVIGKKKPDFAHPFCPKWPVLGVGRPGIADFGKVKAFFVKMAARSCAPARTRLSWGHERKSFFPNGGRGRPNAQT
jgi:hypothetical protein